MLAETEKKDVYPEVIVRHGLACLRPQKDLCASCHGRGQVYFFSAEKVDTCPSCSGTGTQPSLML